MENATIRVTQLAVLASLVDGNASTEELDVIAAKVSEGLGAPKDEVRSLAEKMVGRYTKEGLASQPVTIVRRGVQALKRLNGRQKRLAITISRQVAEATDGIDANEADFLNQLTRFARS